MKMSEAPIDFVRKYYLDDLADRSSPASLFYLPWLKHIDGGRVLSLGCGPTLFDDAQFFNRTPEFLVGVDVNRSNIEFLKRSRHPELLRCKRILKRKKSSVELIVGDMLEPRPCFKSSFDSVYAVGCLGMHDVATLQKVACIVRDYLVPGGLFLIIDWTDCLLDKKAYDLRVRYRWYSERGPSVESVGAIFERSGFEITDHDLLDIPDKETYRWGKVYAFAMRNPSGSR